jgi:hypothetical protein
VHQADTIAAMAETFRVELPLNAGADSFSVKLAFFECLQF